MYSGCRRRRAGLCAGADRLLVCIRKGSERSMKVYIVRHGQTDLNKAHRVQGRMNTHLNELGIRQAEELAEAIRNKGLTFDRIYSSPLDRALQTCEIATGKPRTDFIIDERLIEFDFGDLEGDEYSALPGKSKYFFTRPDLFEPTGKGETFEELIARVKGFLEELKTVEADSVLLASHGAAIHAMLLLFKNKQLRDFWDEDVHNCDLTIVDLTDGRYTVEPEKIKIDRSGIGFL